MYNLDEIKKEVTALELLLKNKKETLDLAIFNSKILPKIQEDVGAFIKKYFDFLAMFYDSICLTEGYNGTSDYDNEFDSELLDGVTGYDISQIEGELVVDFTREPDKHMSYQYHLNSSINHLGQIVSDYIWDNHMKDFAEELYSRIVEKGFCSDIDDIEDHVIDNFGAQVWSFIEYKKEKVV